MSSPVVAWHERFLLWTFLCIVARGLVLASEESERHAAVVRPTFLGANWKCNLDTIGQVDDHVDALNAMWCSLDPSEAGAVELCVHPPFVFLDRVRERLHKDIGVGSQNALDARGPDRSNTGATTMKMIREVGCEWVLLGHSDRRNNLGESNKLIASKVQAALEAGLGVCLTIGEKRSQRNWGLALATLRKQLAAAARVIPRDAWKNVVCAYEPVWAVGEGATPCSPEEAQRVNAALRGWIRENVGDDAADACRLTYTGSVNEENAADYAALPDVDGFVVGRAGLDTTKLRSIIHTLTSSSTGHSCPTQ